MRRRAFVRRSTAARQDRRARWPIAAAFALAAAAAPTASAHAAGTSTVVGSASPCAAAAAEPGSRSLATLRAALRCGVNAERRARGLTPLRPDHHLNRAARRHARDMVRRGYFAHERPGWTFPGRLADAGWSGTSAAEAIAWGCDGRGSPAETLRAWLESGAHRAIVLGGYARVGIGLALGAPARDRCGAAGTWVLDAGA